MGKRSKKIKKNIMAIDSSCNKQNDSQENMAMIEKINFQIAEYKENGEYEDALTTIIDAFEKGYVNKKLVSDTATIYYALGDYERTTIWAKKALSFEKDDIDIEILLAKVYALQDNMSDCFFTLENLIENHQQISAEICSEIEDLLNYFADDYEENDLLNSYPLISDFIQSAETVLDDTLDVEEEDIANEYVEVHSQANGEKAIDDDKNDLSSLKNKSIDEVIAAIMQQPVSLVEKVDLCLQFAVYYYIQKDTAKTLILLKQGLLIDGNNSLVLKNAGFVLAEMGEKVGALEILSKIKEKDLMVLKQIEVLSGNK